MDINFQKKDKLQCMTKQEVCSNKERQKKENHDALNQKYEIPRISKTFGACMCATEHLLIIKAGTHKGISPCD